MAELENNPGQDSDVRLIKVGDDYISARSIERFIEIEGDIYVSTTSGKEQTLHEKSPDDNFTMDGLARKLNEKAHDIIYMQAFFENDESIYEDEKESNLLFKKWLESRNKR